MINTIVISLAGDTLRRKRIASLVPPSLKWSFLDATDGRRPESISAEYAVLLADRFWGEKRIKPGAYGCFVSHYRVWRMCVDSDKPVLVLEDDVVFRDGGAMVEEKVSAVIEQTEFDIVIMHRRAASWLALYTACRRAAFLPGRGFRAAVAEKLGSRIANGRAGTGVCIVPLREVVERIVDAGLVPLSNDTVGTECYFVTVRGARKLIDLARRHGSSMGVDWFMLGSAMPGSSITGRWKTPGRAAAYLAGEEPLKVGVMRDWIAEPLDRDVGGSTIGHSDYINLQEYRARLGKLSATK